MADLEPMVETGPGPPKKKTRLGTWFAVIFVLGFGVALLGMTSIKWGKTCHVGSDEKSNNLPMFMALHGGAGVFASFFFLACEVAYIESKDPYNDGGLRGISLKIFLALIMFYVGSGIFGTMMYKMSKDCEMVSFTVYRWTWATVLLFCILLSMMFLQFIGTVGASFFSKVGHTVGSIFQALADVFNTVADILDEDHDAPGNEVPKSSAAAKFATYVNHGMLMWFFLYILFEAWKERELPCDTPLRRYLYVFGSVGLAITYMHFMWELFAGKLTRQKMEAQKFKFLFIAALGYFAWGFIGFKWVHTSETCPEDGNAVETYRISYLLTLMVLCLAILGALAALLGILDFLCSGKMRFVVIISTGNEDEEEDDDIATY